MNRIDLFKNALRERKAVKIIAGIDNFDKESVRNVVNAAQMGGASAVDICYNEEIISMVKEMTSLPVFVSSIVPTELANAVRLGADAIEVGNFDALYKKGMRITSEEVLNIVNETLRLLDGEKTFICVTVPGHIDISEQILLANRLEELGIDLIQTEGAATTSPNKAGARGLLQTAEVSISNTIELVRNTSIPVMTASGITTTTAPLAIASGASAIGVGSCVNKLNSTIAMVAVVKSLVECVSRSNKTETVNA
jgi:putative N-acetylmannosamine-6-phosphate epimerase